MERETFDLIERYMLRCMDDAAHDREHVYRVGDATVVCWARGGGDFYQSLFGLVLVLSINCLVRKLDPEYALF